MISPRTRWDPLEDNHDTILAELDCHLEVGVGNFVPEPRQRNLGGYVASIEATAFLLRRGGVTLVG